MAKKRKSILGDVLQSVLPLHPGGNSGWDSTNDKGLNLPGLQQVPNAFKDNQYGIVQQDPMLRGTRMYSWENQKDKGGNRIGWGLLSDIEKTKAELYNGYKSRYDAKTGRSPSNYFTDGMAISNEANPEHWRYKWFKQQAKDHAATWDTGLRDIYDAFDRGETTRTERNKARDKFREEHRRDERKWDYGMKKGGYQVPAHIKALYKMGLLEGY